MDFFITSFPERIIPSNKIPDIHLEILKNFMVIFIILSFQSFRCDTIQVKLLMIPDNFTPVIHNIHFF